MAETFTIGAVARRSGVPVETIRFYEAEGIIPAAARTEGGYRLYTPPDIRRLRLIRRSRLLGVSLADAKALADQAFTSECADFAEQLLDRIATQRADLDRRMAELAALRTELDELEQHVRHDRKRAQPGQLVATCGFCPLLDEEGGDDR